MSPDTREMGEESFLSVPPYMEEEDDSRLSDPLGADSEMSPDLDTANANSLSKHDAGLDDVEADVDQPGRVDAVDTQIHNDATAQQTEADDEAEGAGAEACLDSSEHEPHSPIGGSGDTALLPHSTLHGAPDLGCQSPAAADQETAAQPGSDGDSGSYSDDGEDGGADQPQGSLHPDQQLQQQEGSLLQDSDPGEGAGEELQQHESPGPDGGVINDLPAGMHGAAEHQQQTQEQLGDQGEQSGEISESDRDEDEQESDDEQAAPDQDQNQRSQDDDEDKQEESEADDIMPHEPHEQQQHQSAKACTSSEATPSILLSGSQSSPNPSINLVSGDISDQGDNMPGAAGLGEATTAVQTESAVAATTTKHMDVDTSPDSAGLRHGAVSGVPADPATAAGVAPAAGVSLVGLQTSGQLAQAATAHAAKHKISYNDWKQPDPSYSAKQQPDASASASKQLDKAASPWKQPAPNGGGWGEGPSGDAGMKAQAGTKDSLKGKSGNSSGGGAVTAAAGKNGALPDGDGSRGKPLVMDLGGSAVVRSRDRKSNPDLEAARTEDRVPARLEQEKDVSGRDRGARVSDKSAGGKGLDERDPRRNPAAAVGLNDSASRAFHHATRLSLDERDKLREGDKAVAVPKARTAAAEPQMSQREAAKAPAPKSGDPVDKDRRARVRDNDLGPDAALRKPGLPSTGRDRSGPVGAGQADMLGKQASLAPSRGPPPPSDRLPSGLRFGPNDGPSYPPAPAGHGTDSSYHGQWYPQGRESDPPRPTQNQLDRRQQGEPQPPFKPADRDSMIGRDRGGPQELSGRSPLKRASGSNTRQPNSPPQKRGHFDDFQPLVGQQRYRMGNDVGIRSDQISISVRGPGVQINDHHPVQHQRQDQGEDPRFFSRPVQQAPFTDGRQRDSGAGPFPYPPAGDYATGRDGLLGGGGPRNMVHIPYGPVGPLSMQHRLSDNRNFYMDGGPPHVVQQEQQRRQQQEQHQQQDWSNGDGARDGRGDRLQGPRGQQPQHFLGYDPRDEHPAKQRIQQPLVYREQRGAFPQDGSPYGSPAQPFSRPEPRHPPHFDSQPPYLAPHPAQLRDAQGPGHVIGGYAQQQRRQEFDAGNPPPGYQQYPAQDIARAGGGRQEGGLGQRQRGDQGFDLQDSRYPSDQRMGAPSQRPPQRTPSPSPQRFPGPGRQQNQPPHLQPQGGGFPRGQAFDGREEDPARGVGSQQRAEAPQRGQAPGDYLAERLVRRDEPRVEARQVRRPVSPAINLMSPPRTAERRLDRTDIAAPLARLAARGRSPSPRRSDRAAGQSSVPESRGEPRRKITPSTAAATPAAASAASSRSTDDPNTSQRSTAAVRTDSRAPPEKGAGTRAKEYSLAREEREAVTAAATAAAPSKPARARSPSRRDPSPPSKRSAGSLKSPVPTSVKPAATLSSQAQGRNRDRSPSDRVPARDAHAAPGKLTRDAEDRRSSQPAKQPEGQRSSRAKSPPPSAARISQSSIIPTNSRQAEAPAVLPATGQSERRSEQELRRGQDRAVTERRDVQSSQQPDSRRQQPDGGRHQQDSGRQQQHGDRAAAAGGRESRDGRTLEAGPLGRRQDDGRYSAREVDGRGDVMMREQERGSGRLPAAGNQSSDRSGRESYDSRPYQQAPQQPPQQQPQLNGWGEVIVPGSAGSHYGGAGRNNGGQGPAQMAGGPEFRSNGAGDFSRSQQPQQVAVGYNSGRDAQQNGGGGRGGDGYPAGGSNMNNGRQGATSHSAHAPAQPMAGGYPPHVNSAGAGPPRGQAWPAQQGTQNSAPNSSNNNNNRSNGNTGVRGGGGQELAVVENTILQVSDDAVVWYYIDPKGEQQGPCTVTNFKAWLQYLEKPGEDMEEECARFKTVEVWHTTMPNRLPLDKMLGIRLRARAGA